MDILIYWRKKWKQIFNSVDENKEVFKKYGDVWDGIKNKAINGDKGNDHGKDYVKI